MKPIVYDASISSAAGALPAATDTADVVDAAVVTLAIERGANVLTGDGDTGVWWLRLACRWMFTAFEARHAAQRCMRSSANLTHALLIGDARQPPWLSWSHRGRLSSKCSPPSSPLNNPPGMVPT